MLGDLDGRMVRKCIVGMYEGNDTSCGRCIDRVSQRYAAILQKQYYTDLRMYNKKVPPTTSPALHQAPLISHPVLFERYNMCNKIFCIAHLNTSEAVRIPRRPCLVDGPTPGF